MIEAKEDDAGKLLLIDDDPGILRALKRMFFDEDYIIYACSNGTDGVDAAEAKQPDVVLLDVMMPGINGYEVCKRLKENNHTKNIPIIMLTGNNESSEKIKGFRNGAADYITKPFDQAELLARVATQLKLKRLVDELEEKNRYLSELVKIDGLTGSYNHKYFYEHMGEEFRRARRYNFPLCCVLIDIDRFKHINDGKGHQAGDLVLKTIALLIQKNLREQDVVARYGGDEFALILPHTDMEGGKIVGDRLNKLVATERFIFGGQEINCSISLGISSMPELEAADENELIRLADRALYDAKNSGRNQVAVYCENRR